MNSLLENPNEKELLLQYLDNKANNQDQLKFIRDFYEIFFKNTPFCVDCKVVKKWLIYSDNYCFKRFFTGFLKENEDYCMCKKKHSEEFFFTVKALYKLFMKYDNELKLPTYFSDLERDIKDYMMLYRERLYNIERERLLCEREQIQDNKRSIIYVYNIDSRIKNKTSILKIGISENIQERLKTYQTSHPNGLLVYQEEIHKNSLRLAEKWLHHLLTEAGYLIKSECFELTIEEAIVWVKLVCSLVKLTKVNDKFNKASEIVSKALYVIDNVVTDKKVLHYDVSVQTDAIVEEINNDDDAEIQPLRIHKEPPTHIADFNKFIEECCIVDRDVDVSSVDIIGKYRLWSRSAEKEKYLSLLDYLKDVFKPVRIRKQNEEHVVNGFAGITLKEEPPYELPVAPSKFDTFVYTNCIFSPSGKVLFADLKQAYIAWQKRLKNDIVISKIEISELKQFLNDCDKILKANVWTASGNGLGYYGLSLKSDIPYIKAITSSTAKNVEKINVVTNEVMDTWTTVAKAAIAEKINATRMSRLCKSKELVNDAYYFRIKGK